MLSSTQKAFIYRFCRFESVECISIEKIERKIDNNSHFNQPLLLYAKDLIAF